MNTTTYLTKKNGTRVEFPGKKGCLLKRCRYARHMQGRREIACKPKTVPPYRGLAASGSCGRPVIQLTGYYRNQLIG